MEYTQGNWKVSSTGLGRSCRKFVIQDNEYSCLIAETQGDSLNETMANAHLISAAPLLYEALKSAKAQMQGLSAWLKEYQPMVAKGTDKIVEIVDNALAKAEGK